MELQYDVISDDQYGKYATDFWSLFIVHVLTPGGAYS